VLGHYAGSAQHIFDVVVDAAAGGQADASAIGLRASGGQLDRQVARGRCTAGGIRQRDQSELPWCNCAIRTAYAVEYRRACQQSDGIRTVEVAIQP